MSIWKTPFTVEDLNRRNADTMVTHLGIEFIEIGEDYLSARMPVDHRTIQPMRIMHGGASAALAETIGSIAANYCVDLKTHFCVGLDINTSHLRMAREGYVTGVARPIHLGGKTHVWEVRIYNDDEELVSQSRLTMIVLERRSP
ncbi:MAG: PaaI family thioesterase [Chlamydiia bacterium]|nr:PaaI family thioesterase [Chlamydiia bacterium]